MILPLFTAAAIATNVLALAFFVSGLRRRGQRRRQRAAWCFMLGLLQGAVGVACTIAGLSISFGGVAGADPEEKAAVLDEGVTAVQTLRTYAAPVALPPVAFAVVLFGGRGRSRRPEATDAP
jgi:hypothetical protein